jgi:hypothetical protein
MPQSRPDRAFADYSSMTGSIVGLIAQMGEAVGKVGSYRFPVLLMATPVVSVNPVQEIPKLLLASCARGSVPSILLSRARIEELSRDRARRTQGIHQAAFFCGDGPFLLGSDTRHVAPGRETRDEHGTMVAA